MRHLPSHLRSHLQRHKKKVDYERLGRKPRQRALVVTMILVQQNSRGPCGPRSAHDIVVKRRMRSCVAFQNASLSVDSKVGRLLSAVLWPSLPVR